MHSELSHVFLDVHFHKTDKPTGRPPLDYSKLWFPTPETSTDFSNLTPLQREFFDQILQLQRQGKMNPKNNDTVKLENLKKFSRDTCVLNVDQKR